MLNAVRFTTDELCRLESEVLSADERALAMELQIFEELTHHALAQADMIAKSAEIMAQLDVAAGLAELAAEYNYVRPVLNDSLDFEIIDGRHPVVEAVLRREGGNGFVGNDCVLKHDDDRIWLLTGPNMAGKSTFLRQNALIAVMARGRVVRAGEKRGYRHYRQGVFDGSARATIWRAGGRRLWLRWWKRQRF